MASFLRVTKKGLCPGADLASSVLEFMVLCVLLWTTAQCEAASETVHTTLINRMDGIQSKVAEVTSDLNALDRDIKTALYECAEDGELCKSIQMEADYDSDDIDPQRGLNKRSLSSQSRYMGLLQELRRKRAILKGLMTVMHGADNVLRTERKRSCNLNLGFHCQAEEISKFADMLDFLASPMSPGKRKRFVSTVA